MVKLNSLLSFILVLAFFSCKENLHVTSGYIKKKNPHLGTFLDVTVSEFDCNTCNDSVEVEVFSTLNNAPLRLGYYDIDIVDVVVSKTRHQFRNLSGSPEILKVHYKEWVLVYLEGGKSNMFGVVMGMEPHKKYRIAFKASPNMF